MVLPGYRPRTRQRVVLDRSLVAKNVGIGLVETESLPNDGLAVLVKRHATAVVATGPLDPSRLHCQQVVPPCRRLCPAIGRLSSQTTLAQMSPAIFVHR